ncbi:MAG TPA: hypothetical protein VM734_08570 [Kofleriaceae bacterium]|jgi:hypothetical protein|nr:hypothetical protein [Kofleriaceae bacterium]
MIADDPTARLAGHAARRAAAAHPGLALDQLLVALPGNDLTTLLLHAHRRRARARDFIAIRDHAARLPLTRPSSADARRLLAVDAIVFDAAADHVALELAPVLPLGTAAAGGIEPNHALATLRLGELAADPTSGLALEAARRRAAGARAPIRLCASQRVVRMQPVDVPGFTPHFRLVALVTAARAAGAGDRDACERRALVEHLRVWADVMARLPAAGFRVTGLRVVISDVRLVRAALERAGADPVALARQAAAHRPGSTDAALAAAGLDLPRATTDLAGDVARLGLPAPAQRLAAALVDEVAAPLRATHPAVPVAFDLGRLQGLGYYAGPFIQLHVRRDDGLELALGDGGALGWLAAMSSDARERLISTGVGTELLVKLYDQLG